MNQNLPLMKQKRLGSCSVHPDCVFARAISVALRLGAPTKRWKFLWGMRMSMATSITIT